MDTVVSHRRQYNEKKGRVGSGSKRRRSSSSSSSESNIYIGDFMFCVILCIKPGYYIYINIYIDRKRQPPVSPIYISSSSSDNESGNSDIESIDIGSKNDIVAALLVRFFYV